MLPSHRLPPWSTSPPQLWRALGPWSGSRASNSPSLTSPLRVLTTPQLLLKAWVSCTQAQAAGATVGARVGSGGVRLEPLGTEEQGQADRGQIRGAGITWWSRSATEGWTSSPSCKCPEVFYSIKHRHKWYIVNCQHILNPGRQVLPLPLPPLHLCHMIRLKTANRHKLCFPGWK